MRIVAIISTCLLWGCASFSGGTLPVDRAYPIVEAGASKPSVVASLSFRQTMNGDTLTLFRGTAEKAHLQKLLSALDESGYFSSVETTGEGDIVIDVTFKDEGVGSMGMAFLTGLTLYLVPSYATDTWIADATVTVTRTGRAEQFHAEEFVTQWQQIFLLPVMPFTSNPMVASSAQSAVWRNLIADIAESGLLAEVAAP